MLTNPAATAKYWTALSTGLSIGLRVSREESNEEGVSRARLIADARSIPPREKAF